MTISTSGFGTNTSIDTETHRQFVMSTNVSVAASAKETLISQAVSGKLKTVSFDYNGNDGTGTSDCEITLTLDGVAVLDGESIDDLIRSYAGTSVTTGNNLVQITRLDAASKLWSLCIFVDSDVNNTVVLEFENKDPTNAASIRSGIIYDEIS